MNTADPTSITIAFTLIAAMLPLVASVATALRPAAKVHGLKDYFLYERKMDIDGFLKTTVGYSLQVAAIYLFFDWTFRYGLWSILVPIAWGGGYYALAVAVKSRSLDRFLGFSAAESNRTETIHGYVGDRARSAASAGSVRWLVYVIAGSTVIGLGGTMMTEIDYATQFLSDGLDLGKVSMADNAIRVSVLVFAGTYVLWGGYRAVVLTEKWQVQLAYVAFGIFTLWLAELYASNFTIFPASIAAACGILSGIFLWNRFRVINRADSDGRFYSSLVFVPLIALACYQLASLLPWDGGFVWNSTYLFPKTPSAFGFGFVGVISLVLTNVIWQFIDISSLQRLQALNLDMSAKDLTVERARIATGIIASGTEAAGGWVLIILAALILRGLGVSQVADVSSFVLLNDRWGWLLSPLFIFAVVVFMLSTISAFISAMAYVSYFDLVGIRIEDIGGDAKSLEKPRWVTVGMIVLVLLLYVLLKVRVGNQISTVLYAVYAFQITIAPSVFVALFSKAPVNAFASIVSVIVGWITAVFATLSDAPSWVSADSWGVMPPLLVVLATSVTYAAFHFAKLRFPGKGA